MLTILLVNNALSAEMRLKCLIRRCGGQLVGQVNTLRAMFPLLKSQATALVLIDLPSQEEASWPLLIEQAADYPDILFLFWAASGMKLDSGLSHVLISERPIRLDPLLSQIAQQAPVLLKRYPVLSKEAGQSQQIQQAKQVLMKTGLREDEAHHTLEKMAMNLRITRSEAARRILTENKLK